MYDNPSDATHTPSFKYASTSPDHHCCTHQQYLTHPPLYHGPSLPMAHRLINYLQGSHDEMQGSERGLITRRLLQSPAVMGGGCTNAGGCHEQTLNMTSSDGSLTGSHGSPVPYLLAGLAAMLALIAFSLFILACSYWKMVGCVDEASRLTNNNNNNNQGPSANPPLPNQLPLNHRISSSSSPSMCLDPSEAQLYHVDSANPKVVVIMAGDNTPSFLAKPSSLATLQQQSVPPIIVPTT